MDSEKKRYITHQAGTKGITPRHASLYTGDYKHGTQDLRTQETKDPES